MIEAGELLRDFFNAVSSKPGYCSRVPPNSTSPATAAVSSDGSPDESQTAKPALNSKSELRASRERDDLQWMLGTGRFSQ